MMADDTSGSIDWDDWGSMSEEDQDFLLNNTSGGSYEPDTINEIQGTAGHDRDVGAPSSDAVLNARLRGAGVPVTPNNTIDYAAAQRNAPSDVTHFNAASGIVSTIPAAAVTPSQEAAFNRVLNNSMKDGAQYQDALPEIGGHASRIDASTYAIGGQNIDQVMRNIAGRYLSPNLDPAIAQAQTASLAQQLAIQLPETSRGMQASFGGDSMISHMDALPLPNQLPERFQPYLKQTLNMAGGAYNEAYRDSDAYAFSSNSDQAMQDYLNKPSIMSTLTGKPYVGMNKSASELNSLDPLSAATLEEQQGIRNRVMGSLSLFGLAKDNLGRKLSADNSSGLATGLRATVGSPFYGTSNLDELARHGLMDEAGFTGSNGLEGDMSSLGGYQSMIMDGMSAIDFNRPFTSDDVAGALGEDVGSTVAKKIKANLKAGKSFDTKTAIHDMTQPLVAPAPVVKAASEDNTAAVEALEARGLSVSSHEQGSEGWLKSRRGILTSTGVGTAMGESPYGETFKDHVAKAIGEDQNPAAALRTSREMFSAGHRGEELGKAWFEKKYDKKIYDVGLITDPNKPNQGTSVDGIVANPDGTLGDNLALTEFKWGTTRFPPRDPDKKHKQQLQHQMYMTGANTVDLVTGYDPHAGTPQAGKEDNFIFESQPIYRDPDWAGNNADFIQKAANLKAQAVGAGSQDQIKEAYLAALQERYPNESDKGLTKEEKEQKKAEEKEEKLQLKQERQADRDATIEYRALESASRNVGMNAGDGNGVNRAVQGGLGLLARSGPIGMGITAAIGLGSMAYDAARDFNSLVNEGVDVGTTSLGFQQSKIALKRFGLDDSQAGSVAQSSYSAQALGSMGEFDPMVKKLTAFRGMFSMEEMMSMTPEQRVAEAKRRAPSMGVSGQQLAGMFLSAGEEGGARLALGEEDVQNVLTQSQTIAKEAIAKDAEIRANNAVINATAVSLNLKDTSKIGALQLGGADAIKEESSWLSNLMDAPSTFMSEMFGIGKNMNAVALDGTGKSKLDVNVTVDSTIKNESTESVAGAKVNNKPVVQQKTVAGKI